ncbi:oxygen-independent coproporphyrinogen III oxidase [Sphingopyxis alaskensis]|uniref:Coproporphyrinogen-III oxidase n=1 Tax=Sphingopyxis alaskensis (strain DSM 13593 / LMG 18877 / RB2256) TaxID=317655 RepID=Q1GSJ1_SPHAL|nr:oxygen-independent coproporphyrinogen III oxidase [Sphingopyxis alaskensis]ABF53381.1 oxygen-independent coproporphyrinogen III oxidase [Sphingopyxis alaskensis RB2256]MCM3419821.1 oxygen-independent coproporphyrinogen III oxidase [Sphingopyxis alaskensis]
MWSYYPDLLARPVPRYTSYPTAMEFTGEVGADDHAQALDRVTAATPISLYVHIPFCEQICWYCGCNTGAAGRKQRLADYLAALRAEVALVAKRLGGRGRVQRIAFGGGSPNAIAPVELVRLLDRILTVFDCHRPEISIELDPRGLDAEWALVLAAARVTRVSLGVQTFAPHVQQAIGRIQPLSHIERVVAALRLRDIDAINFDLMYGLPGQRLEDLDATLDETIRLAPSRIALFGYAHLPDMIPRQRQIDGVMLPDQRLRFDQAELGYRRLTAAGYHPVGFDHFARGDDPLAVAAREGRVSRNFQGFTEDMAPVLLGFGASAISRFPDLLVQNEKRPGPYRDMVGGGRLATARGIAVTDAERLRGAHICDLLCRGRTSVGPALQSAVRAAMADYERYGIVEWAGNDLVIRDDGLPYARHVAAQFDSARGPIRSVDAL